MSNETNSTGLFAKLAETQAKEQEARARAEKWAAEGNSRAAHQVTGEANMYAEFAEKLIAAIG